MSDFQNKRKQQSFEYGAIILIVATALVKIIGAVFKIPLSNLIGDLGFGYFSSAYDLFLPILSLWQGCPLQFQELLLRILPLIDLKTLDRRLKLLVKPF